MSASSRFHKPLAWISKCAPGREFRFGSETVNQDFRLNSVKDRRFKDGVRSYSKSFESAPPQAHRWPADNLSLDLSKRPQIFNTSNHGEINHLAHSRPFPRRALELAGSGPEPTSNLNRKFSAQLALRPSRRSLKTIAAGLAVQILQSPHSTLQETQITTWQKN